MGRQPCCDKVGLKRGPWTIDEDHKLMTFILNNGIHCWRTVPKLAGLLRCGKSCRLRWINYLRPDLKRGDFSEAEENQLIQLHSRLGNKWSKIASHFPGRTDNEIKNHWNTRIKKRLKLIEADTLNNLASNEGLEANNLNSTQNETSSKLELVTSSQEFEESLEMNVVPIEEACGARKGIPEITIVQPEYHIEHDHDGDTGFESIILDELASTDLLNSYGVLSDGYNNNVVPDTGLIQEITNNFYNNSMTMSQSCSFSVEDSSNYSVSVGESQDINSTYNLQQQQWRLETTVDSYCWDNLDGYLGHDEFFYFQNL